MHRAARCRTRSASCAPSRFLAPSRRAHADKMKVAPFVQHDVQVFGLVVIVALFAIVIVGTVLGRRYRVGPPVLLIGLGALLGLIPRFGHVQLDGEIVLLLFLPAILYWESLNTSFREIRANLRVIVLLSIGLVIAAAIAVSWTARAFGMESHAAAVLGAVLSPTDAAAVAGLAKQLPRRTLTVLKAESIINDGTALVLFGVAVSVAMGGAPVGPIDLTVRFILSYLGGIAAGLLIGGVVTLARTRLDAPQEEAALSLVTPFAAFLLANSIGCSGVVARLVTFAFWDIATFLINGALWVFVGVQLPSAVRGVSRVDGGIHHALSMAVAITVVVVVTRIAWGEATTVLVRTVDRRESQRERRIAWRQRMVSNWAGFRGAVSLAAALAIPLTTHSGAPFPDRNLIIFVVSFVILTTVLFQRSSLPAVVRWARIPEDESHADELRLARCHGAQAALDALPLVAAEVGIDEDLQNRLHAEYKKHAALVRASGDGSTPNDAEERGDLIRQVRLGVLEHKRRAITELRDQRRIDDIVLLELQASMDLEEARLLGPSGPD